MEIIKTFVDFVELLFALLDLSIAREIWNGAWFGVSLTMVIAFVLIAMQRYQHRDRIKPLYHDTVFQLSISVCAFATASSARAFYIWLLLHCENIYGDINAEACQDIREYGPVVSLAGMLAIVSGTCIIRVMSPRNWRPWMWISALMFGISIPTTYYFVSRYLSFNDPETVITPTWDVLLIFLSIAEASIAMYVALELITHSRQLGETLWSWVWIGLASIATGGGIWAMHFIGMLALVLPEHKISYDIPATALSFLVPIIFTAVGYTALKSSKVGLVPIIACGTFVGIGIAAMHYTGMVALHSENVQVVYDETPFILSLVIAISASVAAMWMFFTDNISGSVLDRKILAALTGGLAVSGMHYTGMYAASFCSGASEAKPGLSIDPAELGLWVGVISISILISFIAAVLVDRHRLKIKA